MTLRESIYAACFQAIEGDDQEARIWAWRWLADMVKRDIEHDSQALLVAARAIAEVENGND